MDWAVVDAIIQRKKVAIVISDDDGGTRRVGSCLSFASKLVSHDILFVLDKQYEYGHKLIEKFGFNCKCYNNQNDIFNILDEFNPQIVLNDVSDTSVEYMDELKNRGFFTVNFDDLGEGSKLAHVVFDSLYEHDLSDSNVYNGQKFHVLEDEFYFQPRKVITQDVSNILILIEGSDPKNLSEMFLEAILSTTYEKKINVIVGRGYENIEQLVSRFEANPLVQIYQNVSNVSDFVFNADILIASASKIMYDACSLGIPTICVYQNDIERTHVFANSANGIINLGDADSLAKEDFINEFLELVNNHELRMNMHDKMRAIDLYHGYENISSVVREQYRKFIMKWFYENISQTSVSSWWD